MKPRTVGFIQGFVAAPALAALAYVAVQAWPDGGGQQRPAPVTASVVRGALDAAVGRAAVVHGCASSGPTRFLCRADTGHDVLTFRVAVTDQGKCWAAHATPASWHRHIRAPGALDPGSIDGTYEGWISARADCDPAFKHAQEIKAKEAKARAKKCTPGYSVCIPPDVGDVDCGELGATDIRVSGDDPYGLDADGDGIGCES
jgi:hypothetical protein